ncbi:MAG TPA: ParB/RepB/Spo0J family partition protein [Nitrospiria bacterium]|nr:ParB/RepB/Spo0J family partition protein [Nitrospiria bacterium]
MTAKKSKSGSTGSKRRRKKSVAAAAGYSVADLTAETPSNLESLAERITSDGGKPLAAYKDPFGGHGLLLALLPIDRVEPTPFQRNLSKPHVNRLAQVISKIGHFLDPIIAFRQEDGRYMTPNGHHRLAAMRELSAKAITALVVPEPSVIYKILALNTEKAHSLRERAMEVIRMARELARLDGQPETGYALEFDEPSLLTLGLCYETNGRFAGGAYHPILKRIDTFMEKPMAESLQTREERAKFLLDLDAKVTEKVEALKARGLTSPYMRNFVVARINPLRFRPSDAAPLSFEETMGRMRTSIEKFNPEKIRQEEIVRAGGTIEDEH